MYTSNMSCKTTVAILEIGTHEKDKQPRLNKSSDIDLSRKRKYLLLPFCHVHLSCGMVACHGVAESIESDDIVLNDGEVETTHDSKQCWFVRETHLSRADKQHDLNEVIDLLCLYRVLFKESSREKQLQHRKVIGRKQRKRGSKKAKVLYISCENASIGKEFIDGEDAEQATKELSLNICFKAKKFSNIYLCDSEKFNGQSGTVLHRKTGDNLTDDMKIEKASFSEDFENILHGELSVRYFVVQKNVFQCCMLGDSLVAKGENVFENVTHKDVSADSSIQNKNVLHNDVSADSCIQVDTNFLHDDVSGDSSIQTKNVPHNDVSGDSSNQDKNVLLEDVSADSSIQDKNVLHNDVSGDSSNQDKNVLLEDVSADSSIQDKNVLHNDVSADSSIQDKNVLHNDVSADSSIQDKNVLHNDVSADSSIQDKIVLHKDVSADSSIQDKIVLHKDVSADSSIQNKNVLHNDVSADSCIQVDTNFLHDDVSGDSSIQTKNVPHNDVSGDSSIQDKNVLIEDVSGDSSLQDKNILNNDVSGDSSLQDKNVLHNDVSADSSIQNKNVLHNDVSGDSSLQDKNVLHNDVSGDSSIQNKNVLHNDVSADSSLQDKIVLHNDVSGDSSIQNKNVLHNDVSADSSIQNKNVLHNDVSADSSIQDKNVLHNDVSGDSSIQNKNVLHNDVSGDSSIQDKNVLHNDVSADSSIQNKNVLIEDVSADSSLQDKNILNNDVSGDSSLQDKNVLHNDVSGDSSIQDKNVLHNDVSGDSSIQDKNVLHNDVSADISIQDKNVLHNDVSGDSSIQDKNVLADGMSESRSVDIVLHRSPANIAVKISKSSLHSDLCEDSVKSVKFNENNLHSDLFEDSWESVKISKNMLEDALFEDSTFIMSKLFHNMKFNISNTQDTKATDSIDLRFNSSGIDSIRSKMDFLRLPGIYPRCSHSLPMFWQEITLYPFTRVNNPPGDLHQLMCYEVFRLCSFSYARFPADFDVWVTRLAQAGFYCENENGRIVCFHCGCEFHGTVGSSIADVHHPECQRHEHSGPLHVWTEGLNQETLAVYYNRYGSLRPYNFEVTNQQNLSDDAYSAHGSIQGSAVSEPQAQSMQGSAVSELQGQSMQGSAVSELQGQSMQGSAVSEPQAQSMQGSAVSEPQAQSMQGSAVSEPQGQSMQGSAVSEPQGQSMQGSAVSEPQGQSIQGSAVSEPQGQSEQASAQQVSPQQVSGQQVSGQQASGGMSGERESGIPVLTEVSREDSTIEEAALPEYHSETLPADLGETRPDHGFGDQQHSLPGNLNEVSGAIVSEESQDTPRSYQILTSAAKKPMEFNSAAARGSHSQAEDSNENGAVGGAGVTFDLSKASYPLFSSAEARRQTFTSWSRTHSHRPEDLAAAGFFYAGYADCVRCFCCGLGLKYWRPNDIPAYLHVKYRPQCVYNRMYKGQNYIDRVQQDLRSEQGSAKHVEWVPPDQCEEMRADVGIHPRVVSVGRGVDVADNVHGEAEESSQARAVPIQQPAVPPIEFNELFRSVEREHSLLAERITCRLCRRRPINCIYLPCGHVITCHECGLNATCCILCSKQIYGTYRIYLA